MYRFAEYLSKHYPQEAFVLKQLPRMDPIQQAQLDIELHRQAINTGQLGHQNVLQTDQTWKQRFIDIMQGKESRSIIIQQTIDIIRNDLASHQGRQNNPLTGSELWHDAWIQVYRNWLNLLKEKLYGTKGPELSSSKESFSLGI